MTATRQRLVVFDMDGTLVDSSAVMVESAVAAFVAAGVVVPDEKTIRSISGLNLNLGLQILAPGQSADTISVLEAGYRREYTARITSELREPLFAGTLDVLAALSARDDFALAVATGKALRGATRVLATHDISAYFSSVQTPDNNPSKPHPGMLHAAMESVGAGARDTVMIGDTTHDMEMAVAAGVPSVGVTWGYHAVDELVDAGATTIVHAYSDLLAAIDLVLGQDDA